MKTDRKKTLDEVHAAYRAVVNSDLPDDAPERRAAWRAWDTALHAAGVYREAGRTLREIETDLATATGERKTVLEHARGIVLCRTYSTATCKALAAARSFKKREAIRAAEVEATAQREADALAARQAEKARQHAACVAEAERRATEAREREARKRQAQDDLRTLAEAARAKATANTKRARVNRRNGKLGGAPLKDNPELVALAVAGVRARLRVNPRLGMKRACELECRGRGLSIKWEALRKHVKQPKG